MKHINPRLFAGALLLAVFFQTAWSQSSPNCATASDNDYYIGKAFFNHGSVSGTFNSKYRANMTVGQPVVGAYLGQTNKGTFGFWGSFLMPPAAPVVVASQGDLEDRVQVEWFPDPLSPAATSYKIYRNGTLLVSLDGEASSFIDFNVIAGKFYTYSVSGLNTFGEGQKGASLGFLSPNGVMTGQVKSASGNPVANALVTLSPSTGSALEFSGSSAMAFANYDADYPRQAFTLSCWVKLNSPQVGDEGIIDMGSSINKNWWLHTAENAPGLRFGMGDGEQGTTELEHVFETGTEQDWHNVAASYNGDLLLLFVDGKLVKSATAKIKADSMPLFFGRTSAHPGVFFNGKLDEVRLFNRQLTQSELKMFIDRTVNADADGLVGYWKFDENTGDKAFDLTAQKNKAYLCGASWTNDRPNIASAGMTDNTGFYRISGVNYGGGTTFKAVPSKFFYNNYGLELSAVKHSYIELPPLTYAPDTSAESRAARRDNEVMSISLKFWPFDLQTEQVLYSETDSLGNMLVEVVIKNGNISASGGALAETFTQPLTESKMQRIALKRNAPWVVVPPPDNRESRSPIYGVWAESVGASACKTLTSGLRCDDADAKFFNGLVDEVAYYLGDQPDSVLLAETDSKNLNLVHYFAFNEGDGTDVYDTGAGLAGKGKAHDAAWVPDSESSDAVPHEFAPSSRLATLNPSNTSADGVDFTDLSTVPVSGYVRFDGTTCFQKGVEILVNGNHHSPPCFTDSTGYFSLDLEPGASVELSPSFKDHVFYPALWEVNKIASPLAGVLFRNQTKRHVQGQLAGGSCRKSIIPSGAIVKLKVETLDGCLYREFQITEPDGKFKFSNLPPEKLQIALTQHSDNNVYEFFQELGGREIDLTETNDTVDFIYRSAPMVEMSQLDTNACGDAMLQQGDKYKMKIRVFEDYYGERCYLDTANLSINNQIADASAQFDTIMTKGTLTYAFRAGLPNIAPPHLKTITVKAEVNKALHAESQQAVVLGKRPRNTGFVSTSPDIPLMILRDPPGDQSSARLEKGTKICNGMNWAVTGAAGVSRNVDLKLGFEQDFSTGIGFEKEISISFEATKSLEVAFKTAATRSSSMETCLTTTETLSTNEGQLITGGDADLYLGGSMNMLFGLTDDLSYNDTTCELLLTTGLITFPDKFKTTYVYTDYHIRKVVIPNLELTNDMASANQWRKILQLNEDLKKKARFQENISFAAGTNYDRSLTTESTETTNISFDVEISAAIAESLGFEIDGSGATVTMGMEMTIGTNTETVYTASHAVTAGYSLSDDEIGDDFTVDVKKDLTFGTPVFKTLAGRSSCPYEEGTVNRDEVALTVDKYSEVNVPENGAAKFKFSLGNISQTEELRNYFLFIGAESNPKGAIVKANGTNLSAPIGYQIPYGEEQEVIVTVERGPSGAYVYEDLEIALFVQCHDARATELGYGPEEDPRFYKNIYIDVAFLEPCSSVDIGFPLQNWVLTPSNGSVVNITANGYEKNDPDLRLIRAQYRRTQGDGAWINIADVLQNDLGATFQIIPWNTAGLKDGLYEIRIITECDGGQSDGTSRVVQGKIERAAPEIFGTPQPADGVLSANDEISITFNEPIRCNGLIQADQLDNNNVGLYNTRTGELIDADMTCSGDKITLVSKVSNKFLENEILRVEVDNIKDLANNTFVHAQWEFVVDRNNLNWLDKSPVYVSKYGEQFKSEVRRIENRGGASQDFKITGAPGWAKIYPTSGTLAPGAVLPVTFEFDSSIVFGKHIDTIKLEGPLGTEPMEVTARVICHDPKWDINPGDWELSMSMTVQLDIEGEISEDNEDIVAAYVNDELRGWAKIRYVDAVRKHMAFLTVYSNQQLGETIKFRIWDASKCLLYGSALESFQFQADSHQGALQSPTMLHTNSMVLREIELRPGWNWISFNLAFPDPSLNAALASVKDPLGDIIKSHSGGFSSFDSNTGWFGGFNALENSPMYQYRTADADTILHTGALIDPTAVNIPIKAGWNGIGYLPQQPLAVSAALASLSPQTGDLIKSQTEFAQYISGLGWFGSLSYLVPTKGYMLKSAQLDTLTYPKGGNKIEKLPDSNQSRGHWTVAPSNFEHTMSLTGILHADGINATTERHEIGAFVGGECRGSAQALWVEPLGEWMFFLTIYANQMGELVKFKLFDSASGQTADLSESLFFSANGVHGKISDPFRFALAGTSSAAETPGAALSQMLVSPNPFADWTAIRLHLPATAATEAEKFVTIADALGQEVRRFEAPTSAGWHNVDWDGRNASGKALPAGVYFIKWGRIVKRVAIQR